MKKLFIFLFVLVANITFAQQVFKYDYYSTDSKSDMKLLERSIFVKINKDEISFLGLTEMPVYGDVTDVDIDKVDGSTVLTYYTIIREKGLIFSHITEKNTSHGAITFDGNTILFLKGKQLR